MADVLRALGDLGLIGLIVVVAVYYLLKYAMRTLTVCVRGWPPAHLDAHGEWKPEGDSDGR